MAQYKKEVAEVIRFAEEHGFKIEGLTGSGHWRLRHSGGQAYILPATPSRSRWRQNAMSHIRRIHKNSKEMP